jgi:protoporphyrinogen oxidase
MEPLCCESIYTERPVKVICIGAGASGLLLAYKINKHCRNFELTVNHIADDRTFGDRLLIWGRSMRRTKTFQERGMRTITLGQSSLMCSIDSS